MTKLLVSVRSADEAVAAIAGGADLIDVKEPQLGSLGAASPAIWREVSEAIKGCVPLSVALGELAESHIWEWPLQLSLASYCKLGLAGWKNRPWTTFLQRAIAATPDSTENVLVIYADHVNANAPAPIELLEWSTNKPFAAVLIDTWDKSRGDLFSHISPSSIDEMIKEIQASDRMAVLAGSLTPKTIPRALEFEPDLIAVRSAVCGRGRTSNVELERVEAISKLVRQGPLTHVDTIRNNPL